MRKDFFLFHIDFLRKSDLTIDFVTYSGCKLAHLKKLLPNSNTGFELCNNNVMLWRACGKCIKQIRVANYIVMGDYIFIYF